MLTQWRCSVGAQMTKTNRVRVQVFSVEPASQPVPATDADFAAYAVHSDAIVKEAREFFAVEMARHGFGRKTFEPYTGPDGRVAIKRVKLPRSLEEYQVLEHNRIELDMFQIQRSLPSKFGGILPLGGMCLNEP